MILNSKIIFLAILFFSFFALAPYQFATGQAKSSQAVYPVAGSKRLPLLGFLFACCIFFVSFAFTSPAYAAEYYVSPTGDDNASGLVDAPFKSIQEAADIVNPGDTVIVADGTYTDTDADGNIVIFNRGGTADNSIIFKGETKWGTKLSGQNNTASVCLNFGAAAQYIKIEDLDIYGCSYFGIQAASATNHITLYRNKIHDIGRRCTDYAYGISAIWTGYLNNVDYWTIDSNLIYTNGRYKYGENGCTYANVTLDNALYLNGSYYTVTNNILYNNNSGVHLGIKGSYCPTCGKHYKVVNNTFGQSTVIYEGILSIVGRDSGYTGTVDDILIENNIFASSNVWAIMCWGLNYCAGADMTNIIIKNNITKNENLIFNLVGDPYTDPDFTISGNIIKQDPLFVDYNTYDFHLQSGSPAINAGITTDVPTLDYNGITRSSPPEIGAYEYVSGGGGDITSPAAPTGMSVQ